MYFKCPYIYLFQHFQSFVHIHVPTGKSYILPKELELIFL